MKTELLLVVLVVVVVGQGSVGEFHPRVFILRQLYKKKEGSLQTDPTHPLTHATHSDHHLIKQTSGAH